ALFVERASQKRRGFALTERNRDAVQQLVRMLDGLPLAIELATARIKVMSPQKMVSRMGQRFKLLATGRRNTTQRQATLRATIDWSWELLEDWERVALTQCAIFEGGFTLEAAEAVLALGEDVPHWPMDAVQSLVDRSLLRPLGENRRGEHRFGMLISIREYTLEKLSLWDTEAVDAARRRHASFYAQFGDPHALEALEGVEGASRWWTLRAEADNLLAAHRFAIHGNDVDVASSLALALSALAERQQFTIAIDALRATLNLDNIDNHDATVAQLHQRLGYLQWTRGQMDDAKTHGHNALAIYRAVGDRRGEGIVRNNLGNLCSDLGEIAAARAHYTAALAIHRAVGDRLREGNVRCSLGILHQEQGQMDDARAHYTAALAIYREAGNRRGEGIVRNNLGNLCRVLGEIAAARTHYTAAMAIHRAVGNRRGEGYVLGSLGNLHASQGRLDEARTYYTGALAAHREVGNRLSEGIVLSNLGILYFELGQLDESRAHYTDALALHQESGRRRGKGSVLGGLGLIEVIRGQVDRGRSHLKNGESILREINDQLSLGALLCNRAHAEHIAHHPDAAIEALDQARQIAHDLNVGTRSGLARRIAEVESLLDAARTT
ncbi:MAG: tetratricopeptide repeat protein, partial [Myxococcota bacterium]